MLLRLGLLAMAMAPAFGYSILTHEAIVDAVWLDTLKPLLLKRFPRTTAEELRKAHAYAYGGAIIQDSGYYPFGSHLFSDLVHYVRSGDFIVQLVEDAHDVNEFAFALGAVSHYAADDKGHSIATNHVVPMLYPKLKAKFGEVITYENDPAAHLKTEFGFDVSQVARGNYSPESYHDFIGFEVSKPLLERAFEATYGLKLSSLFFSVDLALGTYRRTVSSIVPSMTKVAWAMKKDDLKKARPTLSRKQFIYNMSRASYEREWGSDYKRPGFFARLLAWFFSVIPKVGPARALAFRAPTPAAEELFVRSFNQALEMYRKLAPGSVKPDFRVPNRNFDTGDPIEAGQYRMVDETYADLVHRLAKDDFKTIPPALRTDILRFYAQANASQHTPEEREEWTRLQTDLARLRVASQ